MISKNALPLLKKKADVPNRPSLLLRNKLHNCSENWSKHEIRVVLMKIEWKNRVSKLKQNWNKLFKNCSILPFLYRASSTNWLSKTNKLIPESPAWTCCWQRKVKSWIKIYQHWLRKVMKPFNWKKIWRKDRAIMRPDWGSYCKDFKNWKMLYNRRIMSWKNIALVLKEN